MSTLHEFFVSTNLNLNSSWAHFYCSLGNHGNKNHALNSERNIKLTRLMVFILPQVFLGDILVSKF